MVGGAFPRRNERGENLLCHRTKEHRVPVRVSTYAADNVALTVRCVSGREIRANPVPAQEHLPRMFA